MLRHRPLIALALSVGACAQIAGFDELSSKHSQADAGASGAAGTRVTTGGNAAKAGNGSGAVGAESDAGEMSSGGAVGEAGNANSNNASGTANAGGGGASGGGSGSAGGGASAGTAGSGGTEVVGGCNQQQITNGFFDAGPSAGWQQASTAPGIIDVSNVILRDDNARLAAAGIAPVSGRYLAWFGNKPNSEQGTRVNLFQKVTIPVNVNNLVVSGSIRIRTESTDPEKDIDQFEISLTEQNDLDSIVWVFKLWYPSDATDRWTAFEAPEDDPDVLATLAGHTWNLIASSKSDTGDETDFWLDSLSFVAGCP
jgi:hypothetical protein